MKKNITAQDIQNWLNGEILRSGWIRQQYRLLGLIAILFFVYILGGYHSMQQHHRLTDLKNEVRDAKFEYLTISAKRVDLTRQSKVASTLEERGSALKENRKPTILIK